MSAPAAARFGIVNGSETQSKQHKAVPRPKRTTSSTSPRPPHMKLFHIYDEYMQLRQRRIPNKYVCVVLGLAQLLVTAAALAQHIYSLVVYQQVLHCQFNSTGPEAAFLGTDIIIFDVGLFHNLWGINECIAIHLDGGYGRFGWCISQTGALLSFLAVALLINKPRPMHLWPMLIQQSVYGIGLLILSLAALPRLLPVFVGGSPSSDNLIGDPGGAAPTEGPNDQKGGGAIFFPMLLYIFGAGINFFLLYVYWHWYWFIEEQHKSSKKKPNSSALLRSQHTTATNNLNNLTTTSIR